MAEQHKHGGYRKMLTWEEKMTIVEPANVTKFIGSAIVGCECDCMKKIQQLGEQGSRVVTELRESRLAGNATHSWARTHTFLSPITP